MKLYEIAEQYKNLENLLENDDIPAELIKEGLGQLEGQFNEKAENICKIIKNNESDIKGLKEEEKRLADRRKALESKNSSLKDYLDSTMKQLDIKKVNSNIFTLSIQKNQPSVNITALESIPAKYFIEQEPLLNKKAILQDLKQNIEVVGAEIKQTKSLRIR